MSMLLIKAFTALFILALASLLAAKRSTAAMRHLVCVCALAGSLILPLAALFPEKVTAIRLPAFAAISSSQGVTRAGQLAGGAYTAGPLGFGLHHSAASPRDRPLARRAIGPLRHFHQGGRVPRRR